MGLPYSKKLRSIGSNLVIIALLIFMPPLKKDKLPMASTGYGTIMGTKLLIRRISAGISLASTKTSKAQHLKG